MAQLRAALASRGLGLTRAGLPSSLHVGREVKLAKSGANGQKEKHEVEGRASPPLSASGNRQSPSTDAFGNSSGFTFFFDFAEREPEPSHVWNGL